ncbi:MAG TPA: lytic transglycosylase domain-containing protein [Myxococcales bacterium]|nr:lytic transglycosylase domain-containing protein [Myxococcales bacterium]
MTSTLFVLAAALLHLHGMLASAAPDAAVQAGALLAAGKPAEAEAMAAPCADSRCRLVLARALVAQAKYAAAAAALHDVASLGALEPYARLVEGEALLRAAAPAEAIRPLRAAAAADGPVSLRASALLADALLAAGELPAAWQAAVRAAAMPGQPPDVETSLAWDAAQALRAQPDRAADAAEALRTFWLRHPEHPAAETARAMQRELGIPLPEPTGRELLLRASRLLTAGQPAAAVAQAEVAAGMLAGEDRAEALLLHARALGADGRRTDAAPSLEEAWKHGTARVAAPAGMLLARDRARRGFDVDALRIAAAVAKKFPAALEAEESALFSARLLTDAGKRRQARAKLIPLARKRAGPNSSLARWTLAWLSWQDHARDAAERFAEFAATASSDEERAQGLYWQARAGTPEAAPGLYRRVTELDSIGWYGLLARERLGEASAEPAPFPGARTAPEAPPPDLAVAAELASLGFLPEASAEADWFVQRHPGDAGALALPIYQRAGRPDRSVLLAIALVGDRGARAPRPLLEAAYPEAFPAQIARASERTRLDPYLLLAVMRRESLFRPEVRSAAGAVGLLQLLPATARRAAVVLGRPALRDEQLVDPDTAIDLGGWYFSELVGRFGDPAVALAAYNAGPRAAMPWAVRGKGADLDEWVEDVPYRETRRYIKVVVGAWSAYRILAGGSAPRLSSTVPEPKAGANF